MKRTFNPSSVRRPFGNYNHGLLVPPGASLLVTSGQLGVEQRSLDGLPHLVDRLAAFALKKIADQHLGVGLHRVGDPRKARIDVDVRA